MKKLFIGASALMLAFAVNQTIAANNHKTPKKAKRDCTNCNAENKKCIDNVCVTGTKYYTSSVLIGTNPVRYKCTYHYEWRDGSVSPDYTLISGFQCPL
ncbi:hypothetical protein FHW36_109131 [Chitinophaga polysaccharea]|uniref:Uncharacterized protein n=1 Tax=Chitinophaga polysaccharea TaxID=1293035 RepID=A0A561PB34_9BACT|nr:hypothetical protein [Chitinophaga polysaccharea]TWF35342.1 hypothetical protein FHW36_109131 [Chitinophaga polysaccharea]